MMRVERRGLGIALVAASAVAYSTAGFFTRLIPLDPWTILFWRGLVAAAFIAAVVLIRDGRGAFETVRAMGLPGLVATACSGFATILFINAFRRTSVADVMIIFATAPLLTAAIGWAVFRARQSRPTLIASAAALVGVIIMVGGAGVQSGPFGDLLALGTTVLMAMMMLIIRRYRDTPMLPAAGLSAVLSASLAWPFAALLHVSAADMIGLALFGTTQLGLGLLLLTLGARLISATESALVNTLEVPLAALWVWLAFGEMPPSSTVVGGIIVVAAVVGHIAIGQTGRLHRPIAVAFRR